MTTSHLPAQFRPATLAHAPPSAANASSTSGRSVARVDARNRARSSESRDTHAHCAQTDDADIAGHGESLLECFMRGGGRRVRPGVSLAQLGRRRAALYCRSARRCARHRGRRHGWPRRWPRVPRAPAGEKSSRQGLVGAGRSVAVSRYWVRKVSVFTEIGLPVASAMARWNATSACTPSPPSATVVEVAPARRRCRPCPCRCGSARPAAATSASIDRRSSHDRAPTRACRVAVVDAQRPDTRLVGDEYAAALARLHQPSYFSRAIASRITVRLTPNSSDSTASVGSLAPRGNAPPRSSRAGCSATLSVRGAGGIFWKTGTARRAVIR